MDLLQWFTSFLDKLFRNIYKYRSQGQELFLKTKKQQENYTSQLENLKHVKYIFPLKTTFGRCSRGYKFIKE